MNFKIFLYVLVTFSSAFGCPREEEIHPCTCEWDNGQNNAHVTCSGLDNEQDIVRAASSLSGKSYVYSFSIENSVFNFVPSDAFKGAKFVELEITNSSLMALTDKDIAFEGLENSLEILLMSDNTFMNEWDWSILKNIKKLMRLYIEGGDLESIEDLGKINLANLNDISFDKNRIDYVHPNAFFNCKNLQILGLSHNEIAEMKRSMLPNPASELLSIDLSYNKLENFPNDMFTQMPKLVSLSVTNNKLLQLNENVFSPVWSQLETFNALGNDLRCDCRTIWILSKTLPKAIRAICAQPQDLKGKSLDSLTSKDLWCY